MIKTKKLNFKYDKIKILKEISCEISKGDFVGIIGPNGAGKSTFVKCLSGFLKPNAGKIFIDNEAIEKYDKTKLAKKIAVVVQQPYYEFDFSVTEIVLMGRFHNLKFLESYGRTDFEITKKTLETLSISHLAERKISELSGGEVQLVMIALALNQNTDVLLFDEPASHLDIHHQINIFTILKKMNKQQGKTILAVSHNINLTAEYCDKIMLMSDGQIVEFGTVENVLHSENLSKTFQIPIKTTRNPFTNKPGIIYNYKQDA
ncbi:MAG: ABC transporter ATP-binding protein [Candidatus Cloacimonadota bacterium]|nr:ABC transporter ATP-binding protein [Candidatus Cloacimonadota bacterium]